MGWFSKQYLISLKRKSFVKMDQCSRDCEWEKCSNTLNQERLFQYFHFMMAFLRKFPFTYFHLLVLRLPVGDFILTLQDSKTIKAKHPDVSKPQYIEFFLLY